MNAAGAQAAWLPGGRLHLHHGPIDIVLQGWGEPGAVAAGHARAFARFATILAELAAELPALRSAGGPAPAGAVARVMAAAVAPFRPVFVTPMAAVAGAVAETVLAAFVAGGGAGIRRALANNGGDSALFLAPGQTLAVAIADRPDRAPGAAPGRLTIGAADPVRGIATSGWRGRSQSLGIADAVTVLAATAAAADAAATLIANAVDLPGHPAVTRRPARAVKADSDLGDRPVTVAVAPLTAAEADCALARGAAEAERFRARGLIAGAALFLAPSARIVGDARPAPLPAEEATVA